jgi:hypothetical protein
VKATDHPGHQNRPERRSRQTLLAFAKWAVSDDITSDPPREERALLENGRPEARGRVPRLIAWSKPGWYIRTRSNQRRHAKTAIRNVRADRCLRIPVKSSVRFPREILASRIPMLEFLCGQSVPRHTAMRQSEVGARTREGSNCLRAGGGFPRLARVLCARHLRRWSHASA